MYRKKENKKSFTHKLTKEYLHYITHSHTSLLKNFVPLLGSHAHTSEIHAFHAMPHR